MMRRIGILLLLFGCFTNLLSQQFKYPFQATVKWWIMSNPSGTDYTTMWTYRDSSASLIFENDTLDILTNSFSLQKAPGQRSVDSTQVMIKVKVDRKHIMTETNKTDNRDHDINGVLIFKNHTYPVYGTWAFSEKSTSSVPRLNFSIGHKKNVRIPIIIEELKAFELTDFLFEAVDAPIIFF